MSLQYLFENFSEHSVPSLSERIGEAPPEWLAGSFLRNGPGKFRYGDSEVRHWFDGMAYPQRFHFCGGQLLYSAKFLKSHAYLACEEEQRLAVSTFSTPRPADVTDDKGSYNCLVNLLKVGKSIYAMTETSKVVQICPYSLEVLAQEDISMYVQILACTAHPIRDHDGTLYNIGLGPRHEYIFMKCPSGRRQQLSNTSVLGSVPFTDQPYPAYYHSFGMTENYLVLFETPLRIAMEKLGSSEPTCFRDALFWKGWGALVNIILVDKKAGNRHPRKFFAPPFFTFHHANAFERDGFLYVDFCLVENPENFEDLLLEHMRDGSFSSRNPLFRPFLHRIVIPTDVSGDIEAGIDLAVTATSSRGAQAILQADGSVFCIPAKICQQSFELPRFNERFTGRPYRFVYGTTILYAGQERRVPGVVKNDVNTGETLIHYKDDPEQLFGEPVFVSSPNGTAEDDGVILVPVMSANKRQKPIFMILDAKSLREICRYVLPVPRIPMGFHAIFVDAAAGDKEN
ncbi:unnamed protein product, partial [Mesorhabditis spiculigera]